MSPPYKTFMSAPYPQCPCLCTICIAWQITVVMSPTRGYLATLSNTEHTAQHDNCMQRPYTCRKPAVDSGLSVRSFGVSSAHGTQDQVAGSSAAQSGSQSARATPAPSRLSPGSSPGSSPGATPRESSLKPSAVLKPSPSSLSAAPTSAAAAMASLSPYNAMLPGGKRQSIMLNNRRASVMAGGRKSLFGAQIKALPGMQSLHFLLCVKLSAVQPFLDTLRLGKYA